MTNYSGFERQDLIKEIERLKEQRDELLDALKDLSEMFSPAAWNSADKFLFMMSSSIPLLKSKHKKVYELIKQLKESP